MANDELTSMSHMRHYCLMNTPTRLSSREALIEAAFQVLSRNPGASLSTIAEQAGVGRATLHRHFPSRNDLVKALAQTAIVEMDEAADDACRDAKSYGDAMRLTLGALIPLANRYGFLSSEPVEDDPDIKSEFDRQLKETREMVEGAKSEGLFDSVVPTEWIAQAYEYLLYAAWENVNTGALTAAQAGDLAWKTLTVGLGGTR